MYRVKAITKDREITIHDIYDGMNSPKLKSGSITKGINSIDSFSFAIYPNNPGFNLLNEYITEITVFNTKKNKYEFQGRVLKPKDYMDTNGLIYKEVVCESYFGYLCDSQQLYVSEKNWTVNELLQHIIDCHNSQVESYKQFKIGNVTVTDPNDNLYLGIQRENTWKTITEKLIGTIGGEITFRKENDGLYLDYVTELGTNSNASIEVMKNMKSISKESDPTSFITRLIPLGAKLKTQGSDGTEIESEERVGIESVNDGKNYIDDSMALDKYGIIVGYEYFDDVTEPSNLLTKGKQYLIDNNKIHGKYSITAIDLSLIGMEIDDFEVGNYHLIKNKLINIEDTLRIIKKTVNIIEPTSSSLEFGDTFKTLSDFQLSNNGDFLNISGKISSIEKNHPTNDQVENIVNEKINDTKVVVDIDSLPVPTQKIIDGKMEYVKRIDFGKLPNSDIKKVPIDLDLSKITITNLNAIPRSSNGKILLFPFSENDSIVKLYFDSNDNEIVVDCSDFDGSEYDMKVDIYFINN